MNRHQASEARRFTWLVDVFYDHKVKLIVTADCAADALYTEGTQAGNCPRSPADHAFLEYLAAYHSG
jgi:cell division protein ZapE